MNQEYELLKQQAHDIVLHDENHNVLAQLGLNIMIYFYAGDTVAGQRKVLDIFDRFYSKYSGHLKSHFWDGMRRFAKLNHTSLMKKQERIIQQIEKGKSFFGYMTSDKDGDYSGSYVIEALTAPPQKGPNGQDLLSYLQFIFPLTFLETKQHRQEFEEWIIYLCNQFPIFHGYAGLTINLPYDRHQYQFHDYEMTKRYWGITTDTSSFIEWDWLQGLKSISWYTLIGTELQKRLNQKEIAQSLAHYPDITQQHVNGNLILKTGTYPNAADRRLPLPVNYLVVNHLVRNARQPYLKDSLHSAYGDGTTRYSRSQGYYWLRRWDNPNFENGIFDPNGTKQELMPVYREHPYTVPYSGMWVPDESEEAIATHFNKGEVFPEEAEKPWGDSTTKFHAVWRLVKRDNGESMLQPSDF